MGSTGPDRVHLGQESGDDGETLGVDLQALLAPRVAQPGTFRFFDGLGEGGLFGLQGGAADVVGVERLLPLGEQCHVGAQTFLGRAALLFQFADENLVFAAGGSAGGFLFVHLCLQAGDVLFGGGDFLVQAAQDLEGGINGGIPREFPPAHASQFGLGALDVLTGVGQRQTVALAAQSTRHFLYAGADEVHDGLEAIVEVGLADGCGLERQEKRSGRVVHRHGADG